MIDKRLRLAELCRYQADHSQHVTWLALRLFDTLQPLHKLGDEERFYLQAGGLLHDIGWIEGWRSHHKTSLRIIINTPILPFNGKERLIIGSIARYHRKSLPDMKHDHYAALKEDERRVVDILASILRLADGLDSSHQGRVRDLVCSKVTNKKITLKCAAQIETKGEIRGALEKGDLMKKVFHREIEIKWEEIA